jgi:hypothetical protein
VDRGKVVAVITGVISLVLAIAYLLLVTLLDSRGLMEPAPQDLSRADGNRPVEVAALPHEQSKVLPLEPTPAG